MDVNNDFTTKGVYGLQVCYENDQALADIVFVHGLTGNRRSTWTCKSNNTFWPEDLLPTDLSRTRIMTYGYDADIAHFWAMASQNRIAEHAGNLVSALTQIRERTDTEGRPIIFVTHSLGGLVTEDALLYSKNSAEPHLQDVVHNVIGICFLGTPHCGSDFARWGSIAGSLINTVKTANVDLLNVLKPNSEVLARVQREFHGMLRTLARDTKTGLNITCFYEELPVRGGAEIVPKHSAILPSYHAIGIHANHMDMTKFSGAEDPGYLAVSGELRRWIKAIQKSRSVESPSTDQMEDHRAPNPALSYSAHPSSYASNPNSEPPRSYRGHSPDPHSSPPPPLQYAPYRGYPGSSANRHSPHGQVGRYVRPPPPSEPRYEEDEDDYPPWFGQRQPARHHGQEEYNLHPPNVYQGGNVFYGQNQQTHSGGKTIQGNFNTGGGNMTF